MQFQTNVNITFLMLAMIPTILTSTETSVLTAIPFMWVNLFQDTIAALALAIDPPAAYILDKKPAPRSAPLIATPMWKIIFRQSAYHLAFTLITHHFEGGLLNHFTDHDLTQLQTIFFNMYVWMHLFNRYKYVHSITLLSKTWWEVGSYLIFILIFNSNRQYDNRLNILESLHYSWLFLVITWIITSVQAVMIFVSKDTFSMTRHTMALLAIYCVLGDLCGLFSFVMHFVSDDCLRNRIRMPKRSSAALQSRVNVMATHSLDVNTLHRINRWMRDRGQKAPSEQCLRLLEPPDILNGALTRTVVPLPSNIAGCAMGNGVNQRHEKFKTLRTSWSLLERHFSVIMRSNLCGNFANSLQRKLNPPNLDEDHNAWTLPGRRSRRLGIVHHGSGKMNLLI